MIICSFPEQKNWDNLMKRGGSRIKRNYFYMCCSVKFYNLFPSDVVEAQGTKGFKKQLHRKIPKVKTFFFLNSYLWTVNFPYINIPLNFMSVNMLNCTTFIICDLSCVYISCSNCPSPLSKFSYRSLAFICMYED